MLEDASGKRTRRELLKEWPEDFPAPADSTLYRLLEQAVERRLVCRDGTGRSHAPFRYWLPEKEEIWKDDPVYQFYEEQERIARSLDGDALLRDILGRR